MLELVGSNAGHPFFQLALVTCEPAEFIVIEGLPYIGQRLCIYKGAFMDICGYYS